MSQPEQAEPAPQNPEQTGNADRNPDGKFRPGNRANPGGRPKGIARQAREAIGENGEAVIHFWAGVLTGEILTQHSTIDPETGKVTDTRYEMTPVTVDQRIAVSKLIVERGFGKPAEFEPLTDEDPLGLGDSEAASIADSLRQTVVDLAERRRAREQPAEPEG